MTSSTTKVAFTLAASLYFLAGCATPEHRMNVAAARDDNRRAAFEQCRSEGRTDCDVLLNAPVNSSPSADDVREQERRNAYDRCVDRGGTDCDDLLHR